MKKYVALLLGTLLLSVFLLSLPALIGQSVAAVSLVYPSRRELSREIYLSGEVEELEKKDVYVSVPLVPGRVAVSIGDRVEANQVLAEVDTAATQAALFNLVETAGLLPAEYVSAMGNISQAAQMLPNLEAAAGEDTPFSIYASQLEQILPKSILAPSGGVVTALELSPGSIALPRTAVCTISQMDTLRVRMSVEEAYADQVEPGDTVVFKAGATGDQKYRGTVSSVFPTASKTLVGTSQQTVVGLYVSIDSDAARLKPGYTVKGVIRQGEGQTALMVPYEAVRQDESNQEYVFVCERARAVRRDIQTGGDLADGVAVIGGLSESDLVIGDASKISSEGCLVVARQTG